MTGSDTRTESVATLDERGCGRGKAGDWLVVPTPPNQHLYRWGRIIEVIDGGGPLRYRVLWLGDIHDSVVVPPPDGRVESAARWPSPGGDAIGVWPR
jgi:Domain of unknown function (DUF1918)